MLKRTAKNLIQLNTVIKPDQKGCILASGREVEVIMPSNVLIMTSDHDNGGPSSVLIMTSDCDNGRHHVYDTMFKTDNYIILF